LALKIKFKMTLFFKKIKTMTYRMNACQPGFTHQTRNLDYRTY